MLCKGNKMIESFIPDNFINVKEAMELLDIKNRTTWCHIAKIHNFKQVKLRVKVYYDKNDIIAKYKAWICDKFDGGTAE